MFLTNLSKKWIRLILVITLGFIIGARGIFLPGNRVQAAIEYIVDNDDGNCTISGTWTRETIAEPDQRYGASFHYAAAGDGSRYAKFTPNIQTAGDYKVYAWWTTHLNRATNAPYTIYYNGGNQTVTVNQEVNGARWNLLGTFNFSTGTAGYVKLSNNANEYVIADAVKFEAVTSSTPASNPTPTPTATTTPTPLTVPPTNLFDTVGGHSAVQISGANTAGEKFTASGSFAGIDVCCPSWSNNIGNLTLKLFAWNSNYATTTAGVPIAYFEYVNFTDNAWLRLNFSIQPAGEYLWQLSNPVETVGVWKYNNSNHPNIAYFNGASTTGDYESRIYYLSSVTSTPTPTPIGGGSPISEPYPYVSSGSFTGTPVPDSPDPLVAYRWPNPRASDGLEIYTLKPVSATADLPSSFTNLSSLTGSSPNVTVNGTGSIKLDFGRENAAWLEFDSSDLTGSVEMSISEYNEPAVVNAGAQNPKKTKTPVRYGNTYRLELNNELYEGVRFGWIHVRTFSGAWHITGVRLVCQTKPANYNGSFSCSDPLLTRIWYTGAYVVKLNLLKDYFGAILMERSDRSSWTGDAHPSQAGSLVAFGNHDFVKANLDWTANQNNGILSYSLYWVLSLVDYYKYSGDGVTLGNYITNACGKLDTAYNHYGTNPGLGFYGWDERLGAGFENPNLTESQNAYKMLTIRTWREFAWAMEKYGRTDLRDKYNGYADAKIASLRQNGSWYNGFGLHSSADAVDAGFTNQTEQNAIFTNKFSDRVNRVSYSPFNQYFVIQAMAAMKKYDDALSAVRDCWGGQINYGGTSFFEVYRPSWNLVLGANDAVPNCQCGYTSLAHPWGAGVVKWLSEEVLGIKPAAQGFNNYDILPHLGRTLTNVSGKVPTPHGEISASFNVSTGACTVTAPSGTTGRFGIPKVEKIINNIYINGSLAWDGVYHAVAGIGGANADADFVYFTGVQPGTYNISASYSGTTPSYSEPSSNYPATFVREDTTTKGNWGGVYGSDGYVLCNYNGAGSDVRSLPSYVTSLTYTKNMNCQWANGVSDNRAPAPNSGNGFPRNVGCIYTNDPNACWQTMTVDVSISGTQNYQVAFYFVDWDNRGRRVAMEVFDLQTKKLVAPVKIVRDFYGGKYLVYSFNKSARFRINHVRGDNATLSGIFFD